MASPIARCVQNLGQKQLLLSNQPQFLQFVRHKGGVKPHRKLRHLPRAPSKMFKLAPVSHIPDEEINQILKLKFAHHQKVSAVTQYLWEDYLKNSDVGEAAMIEAQQEQLTHRRLIQENEAVNRRVAEQRSARLAREAKEDEARIKAELEEHAARERQRLAAADQLVRTETEDMRNLIKDEEALEKAVLKAMDNPIDYEFSIDLEGHIYPGRYTKATKVDPKQRQKIATPTREGEIILGVEREQEGAN